MSNHKFPRTNDAIVTLQGRVWNALVDEVERLGRLSAAPPLFINNTAGGVAFSIMDRTAPQLIRVGSSQDGQGKWDAWTLLPTTNRAGLGFTNNVSLTDLFDVNENIVFWDARDDAASATSPAGTNRVHSFTGEFIPAIRLPFTEGSGTNTKRVFATYAPGAPSSPVDAGTLYLIGAASGGGKYNANLLPGGSTITSTSNLTVSDFGATNAGEVVLAMNVLEIGGGANHRIDTSSTNTADLMYGGWDTGMFDFGTGNRVFAFRNFPAKLC